MHFGRDENYFRWKQIYKEGPCDAPFAEIYQVAYKDLYAKVLRWLGSHDDAEDVLAEIGMKLYKHLPAFLEKSDDCAAGQRNAWLNQLARSATNDYLRGKRRRRIDSRRWGGWRKRRKRGAWSVSWSAAKP